MRIASFLVALAALVGLFFAMQRIGELERTLATPTGTVDDEHIELAVIMGRMQQYHQKLWAAGQAGNAQLAGFYLHELEEAMEEVVDAKAMEDGNDISALMRTYGISTVELLEKQLKEEGVAAMHANAELLANTCNSCHVSSGHAFIRIQVPTAVQFPDQVFQP
jgi:hypothetical protein